MDLLNYLRGEFEDYTVYEKQIITDNVGQQRHTLVNIGTGIGDVQPVTEHTTREQAGVEKKTTNVLYTKTDIAIKANNVVKIGDTQYTVKQVKNYKTHKEVHLLAKE